MECDRANRIAKLPRATTDAVPATVCALIATGGRPDEEYEVPGTFKGGIYTFGLAQNGVGYVYDEHNKALIPDSVRAKLESLKAEAGARA